MINSSVIINEAPSCSIYISFPLLTLSFFETNSSATEAPLNPLLLLLQFYLFGGFAILVFHDCQSLQFLHFFPTIASLIRSDLCDSPGNTGKYHNRTPFAKQTCNVGLRNYYVRILSHFVSLHYTADNHWNIPL
jgi:hypothetical protein